MLFIFSIQSQITQLWQQISLKFTEMKGKDNPRTPPTPQTWLYSFLSAYTAITTDSRLNESCTSNLRYQDYQKRHKQTGCTKNSAEAFFLFYTTNPSKISSALNVLANPPAPQKKAIYRRVKSRQAPRITSPIPSTVEASAFNNRVTDGCMQRALEHWDRRISASFNLSAKTVISASEFWSWTIFFLGKSLQTEPKIIFFQMLAKREIWSKRLKYTFTKQTLFVQVCEFTERPRSFTLITGEMCSAGPFFFFLNFWKSQSFTLFCKAVKVWGVSSLCGFFFFSSDADLFDFVLKTTIKFVLVEKRVERYFLSAEWRISFFDFTFRTPSYRVYAISAETELGASCTAIWVYTTRWRNETRWA